MAALHIALEEGFFDDTVSIRVNGHEVYGKSDVSTRMQLGLADSVETDVRTGPARGEVDLPSRGVSETIALTVSDGLHLGVSVTDDGRIVYRESTSAFGYV